MKQVLLALKDTPYLTAGSLYPYLGCKTTSFGEFYITKFGEHYPPLLSRKSLYAVIDIPEDESKQREDE